MKEFKRKLDDVGRITIPQSIRDSLHMDSIQQLTITIRDGGVFIVQEEQRCTLCNNTDNIQIYNALPFCSHCLDQSKRE